MLIIYLLVALYGTKFKRQEKPFAFTIRSELAQYYSDTDTETETDKHFQSQMPTNERAMHKKNDGRRIFLWFIILNCEWLRSSENYYLRTGWANGKINGDNNEVNGETGNGTSTN